jgi:hypothetical protein
MKKPIVTSFLGGIAVTMGFQRPSRVKKPDAIWSIFIKSYPHLWIKITSIKLYAFYQPMSRANDNKIMRLVLRKCYRFSLWAASWILLLKKIRDNKGEEHSILLLAPEKAMQSTGNFIISQMVRPEYLWGCPW